MMENTEKQKKKKSKTIAGKSIRMMIFLGLFLLLATCIAAGIQIYNNELANTEEYASSFSLFLAENIDANSIADYVQTGKTDDKYDDLEWALTTANSSGIFLDIYIIVPTEEDVVYVADRYFPDPDLGEEAYNAELEKYQKKFLEHRPYYIYEEDVVRRVFNGEYEQKLAVGFRENPRKLVAATYMPIFSDNAEIPVVGVIGMEMDLLQLLGTINRVILNIFCVFILIFIVGIIIYYIVLNRRMIKPLVTLKNATGRLVDNLDSDEPFEIDVKTNDEIEALGHSIEEMDKSLKNYIRENTAITAEKEHMRTELDLAKRIQTDMLPREFPAFPERKEFDIFASMDPALEVGGDFYDFFLIDENHLGLVMADVSGKGIPAALFMMMAKIMIKNLAKNGLSPKEVCESVNNQICESTNEEMFVTVWLGILDIPSGVVTAVNAGHEYPFLKKPDGEFELVKDKHGLVIGGIDGVSYTEYELVLEPGSKLFLYTDGLPEATSHESELFGTERTLAALNEAAEEKPEMILKHVKESADRFVGDAPQFDDLTMMCIMYNGGE